MTRNIQEYMFEHERVALSDHLQALATLSDMSIVYVKPHVLHDIKYKYAAVYNHISNALFCAIYNALLDTFSPQEKYLMYTFNPQKNTYLKSKKLLSCFSQRYARKIHRYTINTKQQITHS